MKYIVVDCLYGAFKGIIVKKYVLKKIYEMEGKMICQCLCVLYGECKSFVNERKSMEVYIFSHIFFHHHVPSGSPYVVDVLEFNLKY